MEKAESFKIQWEIEVSIFKNPIILKELAIAIGIPFLVVLLIIIISTKGDIFGNGFSYYLYTFGIVLGLGFIFVMLIYGGKYAAGYRIDDQGVLNYTQREQKKRNRLINILLVAGGLTLGKPSAAGAGILAESRQSVLIKWKNIKKVKVYNKSKTILLKGGFAEKIALFCNDSNYDQVLQLITAKTKTQGV